MMYRLLLSSIILFIINKFWGSSEKISFKRKLSIAKIGLLIATHWVFFYASIRYSNISIGVVCYCLVSFFTAIFKPIFYKGRFKLSELLLSTITLLGISLIFHFDTSYQLGIILGIVSSAFAAIYTIQNERFVKRYDSKSINYYQMMGGMTGLTILLPIYLYFTPIEKFVPNSIEFLYLLLLSIFCTVALYVSFAEVLKKIPAFTVNLTFNLEPVYAIILAFLFFDESKELNASFYIGLGFVMTSVALQSLWNLKKEM